VRGALDEMYEVRSINLETEALHPGEIAALLLAGSPPMLADSVAQKVQGYLDGGGNALVMAAGMQLSPQMQQPFAGPTPVAWNQVLEPYGVSVSTNMVYDLLANERVSVPANFGRIFVSYPFWLRALSTKMATVNQELESVFLPWTSEVDTSGAASGTITPLFVTSNAGGVESGQAYIDPRRTNFPQDDLAARLVGVLVNPASGDDGEQSEAEVDDGAELPASSQGRLVVIGNGEFATDQWVRNAPQNVTFVLNTIDWLVQDEGLIGIRSKDRTPPPLVFENAALRDFVRYGNVYGVPLLIALAAIVRLLKRRQAKRQTYVPFTRQEVA
jgi:ABC-type uncharacterized transport system involved in gliding motility auxiliary subunit